MQMQMTTMDVCLDIDNCLVTVAMNDNIAISSSRLQVASSNEYSPNDIFCFDQTEPIGSYVISILVRKNKNLVNLINKEVQAYAEAGLISKWSKDNIRKTPYHIETYIYFSTGHCMALLCFFSFPIQSLGSLIFGLEHLTANENSFLKKYNLLNWCKVFLDGGRKYYSN